MNKIIAIIPARSGSKGVKDKNIIQLNDKPLIAYSIMAALRSNLISRVIVSTDSVAYSDIAKEWGAEVPFIRPRNISLDASTDLEFLTHAINWLQRNDNYIPEYIVHLRPTTPLRLVSNIDEAINQMINNNQYTALRSAHLMSESSYKSFEIKEKKLIGVCSDSFDVEKLNMNRQNFPKTYDANGYVDVLRTSTILNKGVVHGDKVMAYITERTYEIDEPSDIDFLEYYVKKEVRYYNNLFCEKPDR